MEFVHTVSRGLRRLSLGGFSARLPQKDVCNVVASSYGFQSFRKIIGKPVDVLLVILRNPHDVMITVLVELPGLREDHIGS